MQSDGIDGRCRAQEGRALLATAVVLSILAAIAVRPIAVPLILGTWIGTLTRPLCQAIGVRVGGRALGAAVITAGIVGSLLAVLVLLYGTLGMGIAALVDELAGAKGIQGALEALVTPGSGHEPVNVDRIMRLFQAHGEEAQTAGKALGILGIGTLLFFFFLALACFGTLAKGDQFYAWLRVRTPLTATRVDRLSAAFTETGRGLFASIGLTSVSQGVLCTLTFVALGVPRALILGFVCAIFSVLPLVGTALVWIPVAIGLYLVGSVGRAIAMVLVGGLVIGAVEFLIGPAFAKIGKLDMPPELLMVAMFGATLSLGPGGLILGPLIFRLAREALELARETGTLRNSSRVHGDPSQIKVGA